MSTAEKENVVDALWIKEAERCDREIEKKKVKTKPAKQVFEDAYLTLKRL